MENQHNPANPGNGEIGQPLLSIEAHNQVKVQNELTNDLRMQPPPPQPHDYYMGNVNIADSNGSLVFPLLPPGYTFVVATCLMQMLTSRGLFLGLPSLDPLTRITNIALCVGVVWVGQTWI